MLNTALPGIDFLKKVRQMAVDPSNFSQNLRSTELKLDVQSMLLKDSSVTGLRTSRMVTTLVGFFPCMEPDPIAEHVGMLMGKSPSIDFPVLASYVIYLFSNNLLDEKQLDSFMHYLLRSGKIRFLRQILRVDSLLMRSFKQRVLLFAARAGRYDLVELLQFTTAELSSQINCGWSMKTALQEAIMHQNAYFCHRLIADGVDVDAPHRTFGSRSVDCRSLAAEYLPSIVDAIMERRIHADSRAMLPYAARSAMAIGFVRSLLASGAEVDGLDDEFLAPLNHAIRSQNLRLVRFLLENGASPNGPSEEAVKNHLSKRLFVLSTNFFWKGFWYPNPLKDAVESGNKEMCEVLIASGADANAILPGYCRQYREHDRYWIYQWEVHQQNYIVTKFWPQNALSLAIEKEATDIAELLLRMGASPSACAPDETAPLMIAARRRNIEVAQLLLEHKADVNEKSWAQWDEFLPDEPDDSKEYLTDHALRVACREGDTEFLMVLLKAGANVNVPAASKGGRTALQCAVERGNIHITRLLLHWGADVNAPAAKRYGLTALQAAILLHSQNEQLAEILLDHNADVNGLPSEADGWTALSCAVSERSRSLFWQLIMRHVDINFNWSDKGCAVWDNHPLLVASRRGFDEFIEALISLGLDLGVRLDSGKTLGETALINAVDVWHETTVGLLLDHNPHLPPPSGTLKECSKYLRTEELNDHSLVKRLQDRGADLNAYGIGMGIVWEAVKKDNTELVRNVLALGVDPTGTSLGTHCLYYSSKNNQVAITKALLQHGVDPNVPDDDYDNDDDDEEEGLFKLLVSICRNGYSEMLGVLLNHKNESEPSSWAAFMGEFIEPVLLPCACKEGHIPILKLLMEYKANINAPATGKRGRTALQAACQGGDIEMVKFLLDQGANIDGAAGEYRGVTALQAAAIQGHLRIARILIAAEADIGAKASHVNGVTAINGAAKNGRLDMVKLLLDHYDLKDGESLSGICEEAATYARRECHLVVAELLDTYQREPCWSPYWDLDSW